MRIAYICSMKKGLASFIFREIKALFREGIIVDIFTTKCRPGLYMPEKNWHYYYYNPFAVILLQPIFAILHFGSYIPLFFEALRTKSLVDFLIAFYYVGKMKNVERIHCHEAIHPFFIGYYCSKILHIRLSVTIHADTFYVNPNPQVAKRALEYCDDIITISNYNRTILVNEYGINADKVHIIRLGVDVTKFCKYDRKSIMIVGQHAKRKGHDDLLRAFKELNRDDVDLWVVGSGTWGGKRDFVDVPTLAKEYGIEENVIYFESIPEMTLQFLYANCTVFCLPSKMSEDGNCEGLPVSLMEAMASYRPIVSTTHTGIPELVKKVLVPEGDWRALARALADLLDRDDEELETMGEENRQVVEEEYNEEINTKKLADFFKTR